MTRQSLAAAVAVAPLLAAIAAGAVRAETQITTSTTTPVATATVKAGAPDDITITSSGQIAPTTATPAVTLNSSNVVKNQGTITTKDVDGSVGVQVQGGNKGDLTNTGAITITESYAPTDSNSDGLVDGAFAKGTGRIAIQVIGPGVFDGSITNGTGGAITVQGNSSFGIFIDTGITGSLIDQGTLAITGDNTKAVDVTTKGAVGGDVKISNTVIARGAGAVAVEIDGAVGGVVNIANAVSASGFRSVGRPAVPDTLTKLSADELQLGGPAVTIAADVGKGIIVSAPPPGTSSTDTKTDADGDGVVDSAQTNGSVISYGSAPALQIGKGGGGAITIGPSVLPTAGGYGVIIQGTVASDGVYDQTASPNLPAPVTATGLRIGVGGGGTTTITGGVHVSSTGTVASNAYNADSTGVHIGAGASISRFDNDGAINGTTTTPNADNARAILIDQGASVGAISNSKTIVAVVKGSVGIARAITDHSGTVKSITNTGAITAQVAQTNTAIPVTGEAVAIDVQVVGDDPNTAVFSTTGVTITQTKSTATGATDPSITGHVFFGSGDDTLAVNAGTLSGSMVFGDGKDTLSVDGGAVVTGGVFDSDGQLTVNVHKGTLSITNVTTAAAPIKATGVNVDSTGVLEVAADPLANTTGLPADNVNTQFQTSGASVFQSGATLGLTLRSLQTAPSTTYTILTVAPGGALETHAFGATPLIGAPFLYTAVASSDATHVYLTVQKKTPAQLGFNTAEAAAFDAVFNALLKDGDIQKAFLTQTTQSALAGVYDQMLPDQGLGVFEAIDLAAQSISDLTGATPDAGVRVAGTSLWIQEVNERVERDTNVTLGSATRLFGVASGYEHMGPGGGAVGLSLSYLNVQENDKAAAVNEHVVASILEGGLYYRRAVGGLRLSARGAGGFAWFSGDRRFVSPGVQRHAQSRWNAGFADAHAGIGYEVHFGRFYARPEVSGDYLYLREGTRREHGGGDAFNLTVQNRNSSRASGEAILVLGGQWGRDTWLRPELRGGYRRIFSGSVGDTVANFSGGNPFILTSSGADKGGWVTFGFSLKGGTALSYFAVEGDADIRSGEQRYNVRLAGRSMF